MNNNLISRDECRTVMLNILIEIDRICKENNIIYFLTGGTLLGAIRHHGFIPWDDDIDIILHREEYNKLINILKCQDQVKWLSMLDDTIDNYYYPFAKAIDNRTIAKCDDSLIIHGIWVDIFPWDDVPEDDKKRKRYLKNCLWLRAVILSMTTDFKHLKFNDSKANLKRILNIFARCIGRKRFYKFAKSYLIKYSGIGSKFIGCTFSPYVTRDYFEKESLLLNTKLLFEGKEFSAPKNWDYYLQKVYGNYMQLPPEKKRRDHHITAWWKG